MDRRVCIKANYGELFKKQLIFNEEISYDDLVMIIIRIFQLKLSNDDEINICYKDEEGDFVCLENENDLSLALSLSNKLDIKVKVINKNSKCVLRDSSDLIKEINQLNNSINIIKDKLTVFLNSSNDLLKSNLTLSDDNKLKSENCSSNTCKTENIKKQNDSANVPSYVDKQILSRVPNQSNNPSSSDQNNNIDNNVNSNNFSSPPFSTIGNQNVPGPLLNQTQTNLSYSKAQSSIRPLSQMSSSVKNWPNNASDGYHSHAMASLNNQQPQNGSGDISSSNVPISSFGLNYGPPPLQHNQSLSNQSLNNTPPVHASHNTSLSYNLQNASFNTPPMPNQNLASHAPINFSKPMNNPVHPGSQSHNNELNNLRNDQNNQLRGQSFPINYNQPPPPSSNKYPLVSHPPPQLGYDGSYQTRHN